MRAIVRVDERIIIGSLIRQGSVTSRRLVQCRRVLDTGKPDCVGQERLVPCWISHERTKQELCREVLNQILGAVNIPDRVKAAGNDDVHVRRKMV